MAYPRSSRPLAKSVVLLVLAALTVTVSGAGADYNLVQNPGFESPDLDGWPSRYYSMATSGLDNWNIPYGIVHLRADCPPNSGAQSLELLDHYLGCISQNLATVAGGTYNLSFAMTGDFAYAYDRTVQVWWGGVPLGTFIATRPTGWDPSTNMGWTIRSGGILSGLTASGPSTELGFTGLNQDQFYGALLDDISVTSSSVPEPGSLSLLLLALPGVAWLRRRRRA